MKKMREKISIIARPYFYYELPAWGKIYNFIVGDFKKNADWAGSTPRVWRNKLTGLWHLSRLEEWSDRSGFFLSRWYDKKAWILCKNTLKPGDVVLDVGANYGNFAMLAAYCIGPQGYVLAFEPNPISFGRLMTHLSMNPGLPVEARMLALGNKEETAAMSVPEVNSGEATLARSIYADDMIRKVDVKIVNGDREIEDKPIKFIKIDVEGWETNVILGLKGAILKYRPTIYTEIIDKHLRAAGSSAEIFVLQMIELGYRGELVQLGRRGTDITLSEFNPGRGDGDVLWTWQG